MALGVLQSAQLSPRSTVRFVAFGDFGTGAQIQYKVAEAMAQKCKKSGCDFAITLGDNIYNNGVKSVNDVQFQSKFEKPYAHLDFPFYMVLGNHDYRGNTQAQVAYTAHSKKWRMPSKYYHFEKGPIQFLALDTNQNHGAQIQHFQRVVKQKNLPWRFAFGHHPRYTNGVYKKDKHPAREKLIDSLCGKVDFYLAGHEHDKQHLSPTSQCDMEYLIVGTGAGIRMTGKGPNTQFAKSSFGFAWFEVSPRKVTFELLNQKGELEYTYTREKIKD